MKKHVATAALAAVALICAQANAGAQSDSTARRQQRQIDSLAALLRETMARVDSTANAPANAPAAAPARAAGAYMNIGFDGMLAGGWSSNPDVRSIQKGDHDPHVRVGREGVEGVRHLLHHRPLEGVHRRPVELDPAHLVHDGGSHEARGLGGGHRRHSTDATGLSRPPRLAS